MRCAAWLGLAILVLPVLSSCSARGNPTFTDSGHDGGDAGGTCMRGQIACYGDQARTCDGDGGFTQQVNCHDTGLVCAGGLGCVACVPNTRRCAADAPDTVTQVCTPDGSQWIDDITCDLAGGRTCVLGRCEDRCHPTTPTYLGCEYWPTVTVNSQLPPDFDFAVVVSNPNTYDVHLGITGGTLTIPINRTIPAGSVSQVKLPWVTDLSQHGRDPLHDCGGAICIGTSAAVPNGAYHLVTNGPVAVYQYNPLEFQTASGQFAFSADSSLLLPTTVLTGHYIVTSWPNFDAVDHNGHPAGVLGGFITVVGTSTTPTQVTLNFNADVRAGTGVQPQPAGANSFMLNQGDVMQFVAGTTGQDFTGTTIEASNPIAVYVGHDCTQVPASSPACDHLEEQLFPNETWGKHYAVTQLRDRANDEGSVIRIMSERPGLTLQFDGIATPAGCATLDAAHFCQFQTNQSFQVSGDQPFLVMQYMLGQGPAPAACTPLESPPDLPQCAGDPAMATEVPVEQFRTRYDFLVPASWMRNYVNVVLPDGVDVALDGVAVQGTPATVGAGFRVLFVPVMPGAHHIETQSVQGFGIKVYGTAPYTSYMNPGGLDLAQIAPPG